MTSSTTSTDIQYFVSGNGLCSKHNDMWVWYIVHTMLHVAVLDVTYSRTFQKFEIPTPFICKPLKYMENFLHM